MAVTTTPSHAFASTVKNFTTASGKKGKFYSLPELAHKYPRVSRLPVSIRIVLESVLRNCDGRKVTAEHVRQLASWGANAARKDEIPFVSPASCCRISPACRCWWIWQPCAA